MNLSTDRNSQHGIRSPTSTWLDHHVENEIRWNPFDPHQSFADFKSFIDHFLRLFERV